MRRTISLALVAGLAALPSAAPAWGPFSGGMIGAAVDSIQLGEGEQCIAPGAKIGDVIQLTPSYVGIVKSAPVPSSRCDDSSKVRANMDVRLSESVRTAEHTICVPRGKAKGDRLKIVGLGEMEIKRITSSGDCSTDARTPVQALAMSTQSPLPTVSNPQLAEPPQAPSAKETPIAAPIAAPVAAPVASPVTGKVVPKDDSASPTAQKLRELNGLLKDGVITQADYDAKKKDLLKAF